MNDSVYNAVLMTRRLDNLPVKAEPISNVALPDTPKFDTPLAPLAKSSKLPSI